MTFWGKVAQKPLTPPPEYRIIFLLFFKVRLHEGFGWWIEKIVIASKAKQSSTLCAYLWIATAKRPCNDGVPAAVFIFISAIQIATSL